VEGKFLSATTPTYIIVFVCLSASTDDKKNRSKNREQKYREKKNRKLETENE
jgi:hypothetical protein